MNKITSNKILFRKLENFGFDSRVSRGYEDLINFQGRKLFNFASNDYLGFSKDKKIINESIKWTQEYGSSLSSSRLVTGNLDKINLIENLISKKIGHEK